MKAVVDRLLTINKEPIALRVKLTNKWGKEVMVDIDLNASNGVEFKKFLNPIKVVSEQLSLVNGVYATLGEVQSKEFVDDITDQPVLLNNVRNALLREQNDLKVERFYQQLKKLEVEDRVSNKEDEVSDLMIEVERYLLSKGYLLKGLIEPKNRQREPHNVREIVNSFLLEQEMGKENKNTDFSYLNVAIRWFEKRN